MLMTTATLSAFEMTTTVGQIVRVTTITDSNVVTDVADDSNNACY